MFELVTNHQDSKTKQDFAQVEACHPVIVCDALNSWGLILLQS